MRPGLRRSPARCSVRTSPWQRRLLRAYGRHDSCREAKPYPGCHRIHGVELVPLSVLLQTLSAAAAECGASALSAVRFEHPIVVDQPRVIQVVADGESVTVSSRPAADAPAYRWVEHVRGRLAPLPCGPGACDADVRATDDGPYESAGGETLSVAELLEAWGVEGQPFAWSIEALRPTPAELSPTSV